MNDIKVGDRVRVEYEGTVVEQSWGTGRYWVVGVEDDHDGYWAPARSVTRIQDPLPTGRGAVIRNADDFTYMRLDSGRWLDPRGSTHDHKALNRIHSIAPFTIIDRGV